MKIEYPEQQQCKRPLSDNLAVSSLSTASLPWCSCSSLYDACERSACIRQLKRYLPLIAGEAIGIHEGIRQTALLADQEPLTAPLVTTPDSTLERSSEILYSKGASVFMMLQSFLDATQSGIFQVSIQLPRDQNSNSKSSLHLSHASIALVYKRNRKRDTRNHTCLVC